MNELNWLVVDKIQASKFEPEYKNVVAAFNSLVLAEDFINLVIPAENGKIYHGCNKWTDRKKQSAQKSHWNIGI